MLTQINRDLVRDEPFTTFWSPARNWNPQTWFSFLPRNQQLDFSYIFLTEARQRQQAAFGKDLLCCSIHGFTFVIVCMCSLVCGFPSDVPTLPWRAMRELQELSRGVSDWSQMWVPGLARSQQHSQPCLYEGTHQHNGSPGSLPARHN